MQGISIFIPCTNCSIGAYCVPQKYPKVNACIVVLQINRLLGAFIFVYPIVFMCVIPYIISMSNLDKEKMMKLVPGNKTIYNHNGSRDLVTIMMVTPGYVEIEFANGRTTKVSNRRLSTPSAQDLA